MECIFCKNLEREAKDIERKIAERMIDQKRVKTASEKENIQFEIQALAVSRAETEGRYLKHKKSSSRQGASGSTSLPYQDLYTRPR
jgi:hypothetical protein